MCFSSDCNYHEYHSGFVHSSTDFWSQSSVFFFFLGKVVVFTVIKTNYCAYNSEVNEYFSMWNAYEEIWYFLFLLLF